jgi:O-antigen ligase
MLGMIVTGAAAIVVTPKRPKHLLAIMSGLVLALFLAGPEIRTRFWTTFSEDAERDSSAQGRLELWMDCIEVMRRYPFFGVGPDHFPLIAEEFGWPNGKEAHSLWLQAGAETGVPGMLLLVLFYGIAIKRVLPLARSTGTSEEERWTRHAACMVVTALAGFAVSAQFVTLDGLETPLYVVAIAIGTLRLVSKPQEHRALEGASLSQPPALGPSWGEVKAISRSGIR